MTSFGYTLMTEQSGPRELVRYAVAGEAAGGGDLRPVVRHRESEAGEVAAAVEEHRAGPALAVVAALLGAGDAQPLAEGVEQRRPGVDADVVAGAVDGQVDLRHQRTCFL